MKKLILISLFSLMFSQTELSTKLYEIDSYGDYTLEGITGENLSFGIIDIVSITSYNPISNNYTSLYRYVLSMQNSNLYYYERPLKKINVDGFGRTYITDNWEIVPQFQADGDELEHQWNPNLYFDEHFNILTYYSINNDNTPLSLKIAITADFQDEDAETINNLQIQIDDLTAQVNDLVEQLTGCVDCQGDLINDGIVNVIDIVELVNHILDTGSNGDCYTP